MSNQALVKLPVNSLNYVERKQWGVEDSRTGRVVRTATTRERARNFAARSKHYRVVFRDVVATTWLFE